MLTRRFNIDDTSKDSKNENKMSMVLSKYQTNAVERISTAKQNNLSPARVDVLPPKNNVYT